MSTASVNISFRGGVGGRVRLLQRELAKREVRERKKRLEEKCKEMWMSVHLFGLGVVI